MNFFVNAWHKCGTAGTVILVLCLVHAVLVGLLVVRARAGRSSPLAGWLLAPSLMVIVAQLDAVRTQSLVLEALAIPSSGSQSQMFYAGVAVMVFLRCSSLFCAGGALCLAAAPAALFGVSSEGERSRVRLGIALACLAGSFTGLLFLLGMPLDAVLAACSREPSLFLLVPPFCLGLIGVLAWARRVENPDEVHWPRRALFLGLLCLICFGLAFFLAGDCVAFESVARASAETKQTMLTVPGTLNVFWAIAPRWTLLLAGPLLSTGLVLLAIDARSAARANFRPGRGFLAVAALVALPLVVEGVVHGVSQPTRDQLFAYDATRDFVAQKGITLPRPLGVEGENSQGGWSRRDCSWSELCLAWRQDDAWWGRELSPLPLSDRVAGDDAIPEPFIELELEPEAPSGHQAPCQPFACPQREEPLSLPLTYLGPIWSPLILANGETPAREIATTRWFGRCVRDEGTIEILLGAGLPNPGMWIARLTPLSRLHWIGPDTIHDLLDTGEVAWLVDKQGGDVLVDPDFDSCRYMKGRNRGPRTVLCGISPSIQLETPSK